MWDMSAEWKLGGAEKSPMPNKELANGFFDTYDSSGFTELHDTKLLLSPGNEPSEQVLIQLPMLEELHECRMDSVKLSEQEAVELPAPKWKHRQQLEEIEGLSSHVEPSGVCLSQRCRWNKFPVRT